MNLIVAKQRHGPTGIVELQFEAQLTKFQNLKNNYMILDRVKYTSAEVTEAIISKLIGMEQLLISSQVEDTAEEGASTAA